MSPLAVAIDRLLPQTQCTKCGYPSCRRYAEAIAGGEADMNQCPPGGEAGIRKLAALLAREPKPLNPANGVERARRVAVIDEARCIGCTLCIQACPVDAIVGAAKLMHTVVTGLCSGCDLCVAPCPVDCIEMVPAEGDDRLWDTARADAARIRFERRAARLSRESEERAERLARRALPGRRSDPEAEKKRAIIAAAVERARAKRAAGEGPR
ncbi:MAG TPA: electron transport complex subunit RsxB [Burkholderiales bacterium]|nr:electron transport complex subunit RsxB [Burkholderiales bacterium]